MIVEILSQAREDLMDGYLFYEEQQEGIGGYFLDSIGGDIDSLSLHAGIHSIHHGYHRQLGSVFPFAIYYRISGEIVRVDAVLDQRSDPRSISATLSDRKAL